MVLRMLGIALIVCIIVFIIKKRLSGEGYENTGDVTTHEELSDRYEKRYNRIGTALNATKNAGVLGSSTRGIFANVFNTMNDSGNVVQELDDPYPLDANKNGLLMRIDMCEKVKVGKCSIFDDPTFSKNCGLCLDIATNSKNEKTIGGLVISEKDKKYAQENRKGNFLPEYEPIIGTCPSGMFVTSKDECIRLQKQLDCQKSTTFNSPAGCVQCYSDSSYSIVDSRTQPELVRGSGNLVIVGSGKLSFSELGNNNTKFTVKLSNTPRKVMLEGPEFNSMQFKLKSPPVPEPYDETTIYDIDDLVLFNNDVYIMVEPAGAPGYGPTRPGDKLWQNLGSFNSYVPEPPAFIAGYLTGQTASGVFNMDLYRIIINDAVTGRKPNVDRIITLDNVEVSAMVPGNNKTTMSLLGKSPFTFVDPFSQEGSLCPSSPFITKPESSTMLESDPCYKKGSAPGKFSVECIQSIFVNNGCNENGKGYPTKKSDLSSLMFTEGGNARSISEIGLLIYNRALITSTGVSESGKKLSLRDWSDASVFCTGQAITSPCDTDTRDTGPLTPDCLTYLWDNQGENKKTGATYAVTSFARSMFGTGKNNRFCSRSGILSPRNLDNKDSISAINYWKKLGGVDKVKRAMTQLHQDANSKTIPEDDKKAKISQCYGIVPNSRATYNPPYASDTEVSLVPKPVIICPSGIKYTKIGEFKLGFIDSQACANINKPEYSGNGWLFIANRSDWTKITDGQRNETWAHLQLTSKDLSGKNVIDQVKQVTSRFNIPDRIGQQAPPYINYYIKHKKQNSSVTLNKCGYINDIGCRQGVIVGMYMGNNWSTQYKATNGQYVVDMISNPVGTPLMGPDDIYELYFGVTTDVCTPDPTTQPTATVLPRRSGAGWNI